MVTLLNALAFELLVFCVTEIASMAIDDIQAARQQKAYEAFVASVDRQTNALANQANRINSDLTSEIAAGVKSVNDAIASADASLSESAKLVRDFNDTQNKYYDYSATPFGNYTTGGNVKA